MSIGNIFFTRGREEIVLQALSLTGETNLKVMLVDSTYGAPISGDFVSQGGAISATSHEISVTGYTGGFGGGGRKTINPGTTYARQDAALNRVEFHIPNITWTALGTGATIGGAVLIVEKTSDADSWLIAFWDTNDVTTNGSDIVLQFDSTGGLYF